MDVELATRLDRIEGMLAALVERQVVKDWYDIEEFARIVGKAEFTVREWCRLRRIHAQKRQSGRGASSVGGFASRAAAVSAAWDVAADQKSVACAKARWRLSAE